MNINTSAPAYSYAPTNLIKIAEAKASAKEALAQASQVAAKSEVKTPSGFVQDLPDEAYAIPAWKTGYFKDVTYYSIMGLPGNYQDPRNAGFDAGSQEDNAEYGTLLQKHTWDVYEQSGLLNAADRYKALSTIKGLDERLHKAFTDSVSNDPRMMELMGKLRVALV